MIVITSTNLSLWFRIYRDKYSVKGMRFVENKKLMFLMKFK